MAEKTKLSDSLEDYVEAILCIMQEKPAARSKELSKRLNVNASSVTAALHALADRGLVNYAPYDLITLTPKGKRLGKKVVQRHQALRDFFARILSVSPDVANETACKMEHAVSQEVFDKLIHFLAFIEQCPRADPKWLERFQSYCKDGRIPKVCEQCMTKDLQDEGNG